MDHVEKRFNYIKKRSVLLSFSTFLLLESFLPLHSSDAHTKAFKNQTSNSIKVERMGDKVATAQKIQVQQSEFIEDVQKKIKEYIDNYNILINDSTKSATQIPQTNLKSLVNQLKLNILDPDLNTYRYLVSYDMLNSSRNELLKKYDEEIEKIKKSKIPEDEKERKIFETKKSKKNAETALKVCNTIIKDIIATKIEELNSYYKKLSDNERQLLNGSYNESISHLIIVLYAAEVSAYDGDYDGSDLEGKTNFGKILKSLRENREINPTELGLWEAIEVVGQNEVTGQKEKQIKDASIQTDTQKMPFMRICKKIFDLSPEKRKKLNEIEIGADNSKDPSLLFTRPDAIFYSKNGVDDFLGTVYQLYKDERFNPSNTTYDEWIENQLNKAIERGKLNIYHVPGEGNIPIFNKKVAGDPNDGIKYEAIKLLSLNALQSLKGKLTEIKDPEAAKMLLQYMFFYQSTLYKRVTSITNIDDKKNIKSNLDAALSFAYAGLLTPPTILEKVKGSIKSPEDWKAISAAFYALVQTAITGADTELGAKGYGKVKATNSQKTDLITLAKQRKPFSDFQNFLNNLKLSLIPISFDIEIKSFKYQDSTIIAEIEVKRPNNYTGDAEGVLQFNAIRKTFFLNVNLPTWNGSQGFILPDGINSIKTTIKLPVYQSTDKSDFVFNVSGYGLDFNIKHTAAIRNIPAVEQENIMTVFSVPLEFSSPMLPYGSDLTAPARTYFNLSEDEATDSNKNPLITLEQLRDKYNAGKLVPKDIEVMNRQLYNMINKIDLTKLEGDTSNGFFTQDDYNTVKNWIDRCKIEGKYIKDSEAEKALAKSNFGQQIGLRTTDKPIKFKSKLYVKNLEELGGEFNPDGTIKGAYIFRADISSKYDINRPDMKTGEIISSSNEISHSVNGLSLSLDVLGAKGKIGFGVSGVWENKLYYWTPTERTYIFNSLFSNIFGLGKGIKDIVESNQADIKSIGNEFGKFLGKSAVGSINSIAVSKMETPDQSQVQMAFNLLEFPAIPYSQIGANILEKTGKIISKIPLLNKVPLSYPFDKSSDLLRKFDAEISPYMTGIFNVNDNGFEVNKEKALKIGAMSRIYGFYFDAYSTRNIENGDILNIGGGFSIDMRKYGKLSVTIQVNPNDPANTSMRKLINGIDSYSTFYIGYKCRFGRSR